MKCPVCKKTIPDNTLKCPYCNTRTGLVCKNCNTVNSIFSLKCKKCGNEILKKCPNCSSINLPDAEKCRKCGYSFIQPSVEEIVEETPEEIKLEYPANLISQEAAKNILVKGILSKDKKIFSLSGDKGIGKTIVLKSVMHELVEKHYSWLYGKCTSITQLTAGGLIQDMLLNLFNLPNICINNLQFKKDASKFFKNEFPELTNNEVFDLLNFLYPHTEGKFEDIFANKTKTFNCLYKIFDKIAQNNQIILVVDNFDFIDGFSFEFLNHLIKRPNIWADLKFLLIYTDARPAKGYFYFPQKNNENIYLDIGIAPLDFNQMEILTDAKKKNIEGFPGLNKTEKVQIYKISNGNPSYINHALCLKFDCQLADQPFELSTDFKGLLEFRLGLLAHINPPAYDILLGAAILGDKININLLKEIFEVDDKTFTDIMTYLEKMDYITPMNEIFYEFSSQLLWETILKNAQKDTNYDKINRKILSSLTAFTLNSISILAIIAQNIKEASLALNIWTQNTRLAAFIGDVNLYALAQKQSMALINEFDETVTLKTRFNISERLGKLLTNYNPTEAMDYLPDAISNAQSIGDTPKEIELLSYLSTCCRKTGNYFGEVECVDAVLEKANQDNKLEIALLKCSKLSALLNIGNCGQIINMIDTEIMPIFDIFFKKNRNTKHISLQFVYESWLKTYLMLANALVLQGNDRSFEILTILFDIIERNNIKDELFICKCKLTLAFAETIKGNYKSSEQMLEEVLKLYRENIMDNETILRWNFINIVNNFMRKRYDGIQEDLFEIVTFANNNGDNFTKNILKTLLGKLFKDKEQTKHAMEIYNDQIAYFAKEKMAIGALLTWYLIAEATLITEGPQNAMEIAEQALQVAQNPKIDNYFFVILLKTIIIECCITLSDFESAKMHLDSAITLAEKFSMNDLLSRLYLLQGKYLQELGLVKSQQQKLYIEGCAKMYQKAADLTAKTKNNYVNTKIIKAQKVLKTFCQINCIQIEGITK